MNYIRINCNSKYIDTERRSKEKILVTIISLFLIIAGSFNIVNFKRGLLKEREGIASLEEVYINIDKEYRELTKEVTTLKKSTSQNKTYMEEAKEILSITEYISTYSTSEKLIMLEEGTSAINLYFDEVSIRGDEVSVYIQNPRLDINKLLDSFEKNFKRIVISEYSSDRLNLRLGDINAF